MHERMGHHHTPNAGDDFAPYTVHIRIDDLWTQQTSAPAEFPISVKLILARAGRGLA